MDEPKVFTGSAHPTLAEAVCNYLKIPIGQAAIFEFNNENIFVRILENVRERDVFVIQPISSPVNRNLVELLIMLDAFKRASAGRITAVVPSAVSISVINPSVFLTTWMVSPSFLPSCSSFSEGSGFCPMMRVRIDTISAKMGTMLTILR